MNYQKVLPVISYEDFVEKVKAIKGGYTSATGRRYEVHYVADDVIHFTRLDAQKDYLWDMGLKKVYEAYVQLEDYATVNFKPFVPRKHSPARGLLLVLGLIA